VSVDYAEARVRKRSRKLTTHDSLQSTVFKRALKTFSSGLLTTTNMSYIFVHVIIFRTLPFLFVLIVLDFVTRRRSICRWRTNTIVVIVIARDHLTAARFMSTVLQ